MKKCLLLLILFPLFSHAQFSGSFWGVKTFTSTFQKDLPANQIVLVSDSVEGDNKSSWWKLTEAATRTQTVSMRYALGKAVKFPVGSWEVGGTFWKAVGVSHIEPDPATSKIYYPGMPSAAGQTLPGWYTPVYFNRYNNEFTTFLVNGGGGGQITDDDTLTGCQGVYNYSVDGQEVTIDIDSIYNICGCFYFIVTGENTTVTLQSIEGLLVGGTQAYTVTTGQNILICPDSTEFLVSGETDPIYSADSGAIKQALRDHDDSLTHIYTETQVDNLLALKRDLNDHDSLSTLDERSFNSLTDLPGTYTPTTHVHSQSEVTALGDSLMGKIYGTGVTGYIPHFLNSKKIDSTRIFWNETKGWLGIKKAIPARRLDVTGAIGATDTVKTDKFFYGPSLYATNTIAVANGNGDPLFHMCKFTNTTGSNTFGGLYSGYTIKLNGGSYSGNQGSYNVAFGTYSLYQNIGGQNTSVGHASLYNNIGDYNVSVGLSAGRSNINGNSNTYIGYKSGYHASQKTDAVNSMALGANTYTTASNQAVYGDANMTEHRFRAGTVKMPNLMLKNMAALTANDTLLGTNVTVGFIPPNTFAPYSHTQSWSTITDPPGTYTPTTHTHSQYRELSNHDSLSMLDEKSYNSLTDKPDFIDPSDTVGFANRTWVIAQDSLAKQGIRTEYINHDSLVKSTMRTWTVNHDSVAKQGIRTEYVNHDSLVKSGLRVEYVNHDSLVQQYARSRDALKVSKADSNINGSYTSKKYVDDIHKIINDSLGNIYTDDQIDALLGAKQNVSDTTTKDATRHWVNQQNYLTTEVDGSVKNEGLLSVPTSDATPTTIEILSNTTGSTAINFTKGNGITFGLAKTTIPKSAEIEIGIDTSYSELLSRTRASHEYEPKIASGTTAQYWRGDKRWQTLPTTFNISAITNLQVALDSAVHWPDTSTYIQTKIPGDVTSTLITESFSGWSVTCTTPPQTAGSITTHDGKQAYYLACGNGDHSGYIEKSVAGTWDSVSFYFDPIGVSTTIELQPYGGGTAIKSVTSSASGWVLFSSGAPITGGFRITFIQASNWALWLSTLTGYIHTKSSVILSEDIYMPDVDSTAAGTTILGINNATGKVIKVAAPSGATYTAGYRMALNGSIFGNTSYWGNQDSLNVSDGIVVATSKKLSSITNGSATWNTVTAKQDSVKNPWLYSGGKTIQRSPGAVRVSDSISGPNFKITPEGGYAVKMIAGCDLEQGDVVRMGWSDGTVTKTSSATVYNSTIGVAYNTASASGSVYVVVNGRALVKFTSQECNGDDIVLDEPNAGNYAAVGQVFCDNTPYPNMGEDGKAVNVTGQTGFQIIGVILETKSAGQSAYVMLTGVTIPPL